MLAIFTCLFFIMLITYFVWMSYESDLVKSYGSFVYIFMSFIQLIFLQVILSIGIIAKFIC